jgi:hypothetical protein
MEKIERVDTHEDDPERQKTEDDLIGKMMNMIGSLREELGNLWTRNAVLEKELSILKPKDALQNCSCVQDPQPLLRGDREDGKEALKSPLNKGDGGEAVKSDDDVCPEVKCVHCEAPPQEDKSCCDKPACEECDKFGKFARGEIKGDKEDA